MVLYSLTRVSLTVLREEYLVDLVTQVMCPNAI